MAIVFALAAAIGWGSSDYAAGHASRKSSAVSVVILTHLASVIALVVIATVPGQTGSPEVADLLWGLAAGLGGGFGAMLLFSGLGKGSMSVVAPITAVGAAMIPVIAGVVQGESLGLLGLLGIVIALGAIVMVSLGSDDHSLDTDDTDHTDGTDDTDGTSDGRRVVDAHDDTGGGPPACSARPTPSLRSGPGRSKAADDALIEAYEREFIIAPPVGAPTPVCAAESSAAPSPVETRDDNDEAADRPDRIGAARSFNELAAAVHTQRDAFEINRLSQVRPTVDRPIPDDFFGKSGSRRQRSRRQRVALPKQTARTVERTDRGSFVRTMLRLPGVVEALFSGIGFGLFFVFIARTSESAGHWPLVSARFISVVMFAAAAIIATNAVMPDRKSRPVVVVAGLLDAAAAVFFVLSTRSGLLSVGAVLASLYPAATVLLARFVGKERVTRKQAIGLVLAGIAVSLLAV